MIIHTHGFVGADDPTRSTKAALHEGEHVSDLVRVAEGILNLVREQGHSVTTSTLRTLDGLLVEVHATVAVAGYSDSVQWHMFTMSQNSSPWVLSDQWVDPAPWQNRYDGSRWADPGIDAGKDTPGAGVLDHRPRALEEYITELQTATPDRSTAHARAAALRDAANRYPTITRDMVSRGSVREWLLAQAEAELQP